MANKIVKLLYTHGKQSQVWVYPYKIRLKKATS